MKDNQDEDEPLSDDAAENLRFENELLRIKMQAESGAIFGGSGNLPPELENRFLQNVQQFEAAWQNAKPQKVYELLKQPDFKKADDLQPGEVEAALAEMNDLLAQHNMALDVTGQYDPIVIYRFITEELFEHESDGVNFPGMTQHFIYEELHPNHTVAMERAAAEFFKNWFRQQFDEYSSELAILFLLANGTELTREEAIGKFNIFFDCYTRFYEDSYTIGEIKFNWSEKSNAGIGHVEGAAHYKAELENGEVIKIEGPFKFYMCNQLGEWEIFYLIMPGFKW